MRETDKFYFFWKHEFGQWTRRDMVDKLTIQYNCCEQYMMYHKAILFKDYDTAQLILKESDPKKQKDLGRQVKNYDENVWKMHRMSIVTSGNFLKFTQHGELLERLLDTGNKILVEASPYDNIWGCGLAANDDRILDIDNWTGQNLLGQCLMNVRKLFQ